MSEIILKIENLSKQYRLGTVGTGTISHDLKRWWYKVQGKEDPFLKIGDTNDRTTIGTSEYVWALKDINFEVKKGEVLGIIGKNGAGKSTLLKILSKITAPTTGSIKSKGRIASLLEVGTGFHPELTGKENIFLNGAILGMTKAEINSKYDEIVDFSGCERYIETPVKRYSSGMTVRLAFAVAAFLEPDILIIDEVLAVGDAEFQKKAIGKMQDISRGEGRTVLFVSHNMAAVKSLCTRGIVLKNGGVNAVGDVDQMIMRYLEGEKEKLKTNISNRTDRLGNGIAKLIDSKFIDISTGKEIENLISGQAVTICLKFINNLSVEIDKFEIGVSFFNKNEELMFACRNDVILKTINLESDVSEVHLIIKKWPTSGGIYSFNVLTSANGEIIDWVKKVAEFRVETGDYYGSGIIPASKYQSVFIDYNFE